MERWQGAQWILATLLASKVFLGPLLRMALLGQGGVAKTTWTEFWGRWIGRRLMDSGLVALLIWGGFF
ncbi:hypothetical protein [Nitratireductor sp. GZWM139]|uniref:hypothetical protein n=1 Tax=Nitratireductor sp. GZWM139 TaxID=2950541 RepID=UPI0024BDDE60|nr:hypothetical protein [Nitratireductor sp. GZWM139]MDJ1463333.1 hypothetical protein [Nitratireductor sp. GZWM139]